MRQRSGPPETAEQHIKSIRRATRKRYSTEEKIRVVLSGLRGDYSVAELCRREGRAESLYYSWLKEFLEAGKRRRGKNPMQLRTILASLTCYSP
jgi:transposase